MKNIYEPFEFGFIEDKENKQIKCICYNWKNDFLKRVYNSSNYLSYCRIISNFPESYTASVVCQAEDDYNYAKGCRIARKKCLNKIFHTCLSISCLAKAKIVDKDIRSIIEYYEDKAVNTYNDYKTLTDGKEITHG